MVTCSSVVRSTSVKFTAATVSVVADESLFERTQAATAPAMRIATTMIHVEARRHHGFFAVVDRWSRFRRVDRGSLVCRLLRRPVHSCVCSLYPSSAGNPAARTAAGYAVTTEDTGAGFLCGLECRVVLIDRTERSAATGTRSAALSGLPECREVRIRHVVSVLAHTCGILEELILTFRTIGRVEAERHVFEVLAAAIHRGAHHLTILLSDIARARWTQVAVGVNRGVVDVDTLVPEACGKREDRFFVGHRLVGRLVALRLLLILRCFRGRLE